MLNALLKVRFQSMFSGMFKSSKNEKKLSTGKIVGFSILFIYIGVVMLAMFSGLFYGFATLLKGKSIQWLYFSVASFVAFFLSLMITIFSAKSQLYDAKDNQLLLSMPIPQSYILLSRVLYLYLFTLLIQALVLLPAGIMYFIFISFSAYEILVYLLFLLILPLFSLVISCLLGWAFSWLSSKIRHANIITIIFALACLGGYFVFCFQLNNIMSYVLENVSLVAEITKNYLFPFYSFGMALCTLGGRWIWLLITLALTIVPAGLLYLLLAKTFIKIATSTKKQAHIEYKQKSLKASSAIGALIKKDLAHFFARPNYILNTAIGIVFTLIFTVYAAVQFPQMVALLSTEYNMDISGYMVYILIGVLCMLSSMDTISAPSISIEAKNIWLLQVCPIDAKDVIMAKAYTHMIVCMPFNLICSIIFICVLPITFVDALLLIFVPLAFVALSAIWGVFMNLLFPKFDWVNETVAVKQGMSVFFSMFGGMGFILLIFGLAYACIGFMSLKVFAIIFLLLMAVLYYAIYTFICHKGRKLFEKLKN